MSRRPRITFEDVGDVAVVQFTDRKILDEQNILAIRDDLFNLVNDLGRRKLLLSFSNVEFMSVRFLGTLIRLHQRLCELRGQLVLCSLPQGTMETFEITNLHRMLKIVKDEQAALHLLNPPASPDPPGQAT